MSRRAATARLSGVDGSIPDNYPALVERAAAAFGDAEAIRDGDMSMTFAELAQRTDQCAAALVADGLQPGDAVGLWAPNAWEWVIAAMGTLRAGGVIVPVNTRFRGREAAYVLSRARAKLLFTVVGFLGYDYVRDLEAAAADGHTVDSLERTVILRGDTPPGATSFQDFVATATAEGFDEAARYLRGRYWLGARPTGRCSACLSSPRGHPQRV